MERDLAQRIRRREVTVAVIGLGYVGLPTAVILAEHGYLVLGGDVKDTIIRDILEGQSPLRDLGLDDRVKSVTNAGKLQASSDVPDLVSRSDIILITVPTPTKEEHEPDLTSIEEAGKAISRGLRRNALVVLESTVYPGVTESVLQPLLEQSGLRAGEDFGLAYCPERYNPGDTSHTIDKVTRVMGAVDEHWRAVAREFYLSFTQLYDVPNIRTAEMAKIIENTQRDLNIALMNEIALICEGMGLDVMEVIKAASTKWNFNAYYPGAGVGGHCLPKDPWYLVKAAEGIGYEAKIITAGRAVNDSMPDHMFDLLCNGLSMAEKSLNESRVVVVGLSYKENLGDTRNSPSLKITKRIKDNGAYLVTVDPFVDESEARERFYSAEHHSEFSAAISDADAVVIMTAHSFLVDEKLADIRSRMADRPVIVDGRRVICPDDATQSGFIYQGVGRGD